MKEGNTSILAGVPKGLPSLVKAYRIQDKVKGIGFDFPNTEDAWQKVEEELEEFKTAPTAENKEEELGDVLFSLINYARISKINPDTALERTNAKFIKRFQMMEKLAQERDLSLANLNLNELDELWNEVKKLNS